MTETLFVPVCSTDDLPPGERLFITVGDAPIVVFNVDGEYFAIDDTCTHDQGPLGEGDLEDHQIICPRHGARFDIRSGEVLSLPAVKDVNSYPIRVVDDRVEIGVNM